MTELRITAHGAEIRLSFGWLGPEPGLDDAVLGGRRHRLNELLWAEPRYSFGHEPARRSVGRPTVRGRARA